MNRNKTPAQAGKPAASLSGPARRVIKKYPNRRLYDTENSAYVTLVQVRELVMKGTPFVALDARTGEDLTRSVLLQIILEEEAGGAPMFTEAMLANMIRFYGHAMQGFMGAYLEKNMQALMDARAKLAEQSRGLTPELWTQFMDMQAAMMKSIMNGYLEQSKLVLQQMQERVTSQTERMLGAFGVKKHRA